jgi:carboxypeptidase D
MYVTLGLIVRGLTFSAVDRAGWEVPQYVHGAAYMQLEFLLGRIGTLQQEGSFATS